MKTLILLVISVRILILSDAFSQEIQNAVNYHPVLTGTSRTDGKPDNFTYKLSSNPEQIKELENRIKNIRISNNPDFFEIEKLQKKIAELSGESIVSNFIYYPGTVKQSDFIDKIFTAGNTKILNKANIKGIATATEYTGATAGRIWAVAGFQGTGSVSSPDTVMVFYSTDNGASWISYAVITLAGTDKINYGEIDAELIEGGANKYLHIVYGLRASGGTGRWFTAGASVQLTGTFAGNTWTLSWPGNDAAKRYYCPKITSDVYVWPTSPWAYVVVSFDSAGTSGRVNTQKFAQLNGPNTISPVFTYKTGKVYWNTETTTERYLYSDIAFFQRGFSDSVIISYCGIADSTKVFFSKMNTSGMSSPSVAGQYIGPIGGSEPNYMKYGGKLSSNGNNNGSIFFIFNQKCATTDGVKYFRTTNYGDFNSMNQSVIWTAPSGVSYPDIAGVRGGNTHRLGFFFKNISSDSLKLISVNTGGSFLTISDKMNAATYSTGIFSPSVGLRFQSGDSCFALYSSFGPADVWSASGCTGTITGVNGNETVLNYFLNQNYPNPFNPITNIRYQVAAVSFVTLKIYNLLGKEVATLVNEKKDRGAYAVAFNAGELSSGVYFYRLTAGDFSDTRKMILVK